MTGTIPFSFYLSIFLACQLHQGLFSQESQLSGKDLSAQTSDSIVLKLQWQEDLKIYYKEKHAEKASLNNELTRITDSLLRLGYLEVSVDSIALDQDTAHVLYHIGRQYSFLKIHYSEELGKILKSLGYKPEFFSGNVYDHASIANVMRLISEFYENRGFPFVSVSLQDVKVDEASVEGTLVLDRGPLFRIREVVNAGDARLSSVFLSRYLGMRPGTVFNKDRIAKDAPKRLNELGFVIQRREPLVQFYENEAQINVFLNKRNASRFDFVLGALPNSRETGKLLFTGTANLELYNQFGLGERSFLQFQRLRPETQELRLEFNYPFLLDLPFGIDLEFGLYSRDTTNRDIAFELGLIYLLPGGDYVKGFWNQFNSDLLNIDLNRVLNTRMLPRSLDIRNSLYGIEVLRQQLDYRFNPRKGWSLLINAAAGSRNIVRNQQINSLSNPEFPEFAYSSLYDSLNLKSWQFKSSGRINWFLPVARYSTFLLGWQGGYIVSGAETLRNEAFRIGGNRILRGFDEESIFAGLYQILTLEYRLLTGRNSNLFVFSDLALTRDYSGDITINDQPYGFGLGMNFETPLGIFGLTTAVGSQRGNPLDFRSTRIHFGYVSLF